MSRQRNPLVKISRHLWLVFGSAFLNLLTLSVGWQSFPILFPDICDSFDGIESLTSVGWIIAVYGLLANGLAPFVAILIERFGCRKVTIFGAAITFVGFIISSFSPSIIWLAASYGVIGGVGCSCLYLSSIVIVQHSFGDKHRPFAAALLAAGVAISPFLYAPLTAWLASEYTWRGALLINAGIVLHCTIFGLFFPKISIVDPRNKESLDKNTNSGSVKKSYTLFYCEWSMFKKVKFDVFLLGTFLFALVYSFCHVHTVNAAQLSDSDERNSATLMTIFAGSNLISRLSLSLVLHFYPHLSRLALYGTGVVLGGVSVLFASFCSSFISFSSFLVAYGATFGVCMSVQFTALSDMLGVDKIAKAAGFLQAFIGFAHFAGPSLAGFFCETYGFIQSFVLYQRFISSNCWNHTFGSSNFSFKF